MLAAATVRYLKSLTKNNNKAWFDKHRDEYDDAKKDFENFIQTLIDRHGKKDPAIAGQEAKKCVFRINRDIRFSKDKTPYKNNFGASINRGGKKSIYGGYYFHLQPGESFVGGGIWMPMPPELKKIRQEIDYCFEEFSAIITSKKFRAAYGELYRGDDVLLSKVPQGFDKESPAADYVKLKSVLAMRPVKDAELLSGDLVKKSLDAFAALQPLLGFINRSFE